MKIKGGLWTMYGKNSKRPSNYSAVQQQILKHFEKHGYKGVKIIPEGDKNHTSVQRFKDKEVLIVK